MYKPPVFVFFILCFILSGWGCKVEERAPDPNSTPVVYPTSTLELTEEIMRERYEGDPTVVVPEPEKESTAWDMNKGPLFPKSDMLATVLKQNPTVRPTYNEVANGKEDQYVGKKVSWIGVVAVELSSVDGIKFWIVDKEHNERTRWFWALDKDTMFLPPEAEGAWTTFLMNKYRQTSNYDGPAYRVEGVIYSLDCTYYENGPCIPNMYISKITKVYNAAR